MLSFLLPKMTTKKPVLGVFDSGIGGFSVAKKVRETTSATMVYFGDCAYAPYGNRTDEEIKEFIKNDIYVLKGHGVTHFVNACNSMSVMTTNLLLLECGVDSTFYTDMIRSFGAYATFTEEEKVMVIATNATIRSGVYQEALHKKGVDVAVFPYTDLARAIEEEESEDTIRAMITPGIVSAKEQKITTILYGCTHYPLVKHIFVSVAKEVGYTGVFLDPAIFVAQSVKAWNLEAGTNKFYPYTSKETKAFHKAVVSLL